MAIAAIRRASSVSDIAEGWRDRFDLTHPVLGDFDQAVWDQYHGGRHQPQYIVFDRDLIVRDKDDRLGALDVIKPVALSYL